MIVVMEWGWFATIRRRMEDVLKAHLQLACPTLACRLTKEFRNSVTFYSLPQGSKLVPGGFSVFRNHEVYCFALPILLMGADRIPVGRILWECPA